MTLYDIKQRVGLWLKTRRDIRRLHQLDNHLLADLGIERDDIDAWARGKCQS